MARNSSLTFDQFPDVGTVEEAAALLRVSRTIAYEMAHRYEASNGAEGLPVVRLGRMLRVPKHRLAEMLGAPTSIQNAGPGVHEAA